MNRRTLSPANPFIKLFIISALFMFCAACLPIGNASARPALKTLPKPFVLNRGDGDTINGKSIYSDVSGDGDVLFPGGPLMSTNGGDPLRERKTFRRFKSVRWIILYRLIK